jgi:4-hydroxybenzoate polyprenyltransferase
MKEMRWIRRAWYLLSALKQFFRIPYLSFPIILPLLGAATESLQLTNNQILGLIGVALAFHIFVHLQNDVVDLPLDRTQLLRANSPLVRGIVQPWQALTIAFLQLPLALALSYWLRATALAYVAFAGAVILMSIYNLWGKRNAFPFLTDVLQGLGWSAMVLYGAAVISTHPTALVMVIIAFVVVFIVMINGVHGNLRDLTNDLQCGMRTTAMLLGARPLDGEGLMIPLRLKLYALMLQMLLTGIVLLPLVYNWFGYPPTKRQTVAYIMLTFILLSIALLELFVASSSKRLQMNFMGSLHLITLLSFILVVFAPYLQPKAVIALLIVYVLPMCTTVYRWPVKVAKKLRGISLGRSEEIAS